MKPNFALILSMEGIALLQRSSPGWELVGDASPESPNLGKEMKALREAAEKLAPGKTSFKIVIPNDQIRYVSVPAGRADPVARQQAVAQALDGQTPYSLDELATDSTVSGNTLQIAAVALETLQEADEFARSFGFTPVSFAAMPETRDYSGEPYFGTAHDVPANITVEPDIVPIRVSGRVRPPEETPAPAPAPQAAPEPDAQPEAPQDPPVAFVSRRSREPEPPTDLATPDEDTDKDDAVASATSAKASAPKGSDLRASKKAEATNADGGKKGPTVDTGSPTSAKPAPDLTPPTTDFETVADSETVTPPTPRRSTMAGLVGAIGGIGASLGGALGGLAKRTRKPKAASAGPSLTLPQKAGISLDGSASDDAGDTAAPVVAPPPTPEPAKPAKAAKVKAPKAPKGRKGKAKAAPEPTPDPVDEPAAATEGTEPLAASRDFVPAGRALGELSAEERKKEAERLTVFGARGGASYEPASGGARFAIGLVAAVFLLGTAGWAAIFMNDGMAPLVSPQADAGEEVRTPDAGAVAGAGVTDETVPPGPGDDSDIEEVSPLIVTEAVDAAEETDEQVAEPAEPDADTQPDGAEAEARYAATGIWQDSPDPLDTETLGTDRAGGEDNPGSDGPPQRMEQVELAALTPDALPTPPGPPPTPGQRFNMDERGLVIATPDGVLSPQGVVVFEGDPPLLPPTRPGETEPEVQEDAAVQPEAEPETTEAETADATTPDATEPEEEDANVTVIQGLPPILPPARPGSEDEAAADLPEGNAQADETETADATTEATEETESAATADASEDSAPRPERRFTALRPLIRPFATDTATDAVEVAAAASGPAGGASLASEAIENAVAAALVDDGRSSAAASLASAPLTRPEPEAEPEIEPAFTALRPLQRPGNITQLAAAARVTQEPPPAVVPRVPSSASVTRQATVRNAINLRRINLIGVYGQPSDRRALVRLANGRYRKVQVGDRIDGGRVVAIGDGTLRYQKNGRNVTLDMPSG